MQDYTKLAESVLESLVRMREGDRKQLLDRENALSVLLRGAYYTQENRYRAMAEDDLRALYRGGIYDHFAGGFFSGSGDSEWLIPSFEKRLSDNALLAYRFIEAWEKSHMAFYREVAESTLDFCLRELVLAEGGFAALQTTQVIDAEKNAYLFTPAEVASVLGEDDGRHFCECYDITAEGNCEGRSIPNLILNDKWSLLPSGYDDFREKLRLFRAERGGLALDVRISVAWNAMLLAALAKAAAVWGDKRYLNEALSLSGFLQRNADKAASFADFSALAFAHSELYRATFAPEELRRAEAALQRAVPAVDQVWNSESDRALALAALSAQSLCLLTRSAAAAERRSALLEELCGHAERHGSFAVPGLCTLLASVSSEKTLVCLSPSEAVPAQLGAMLGRYSPDMAVVLKTPARAAALAAAAPYTQQLAIVEGKCVLCLCTDGQWAEPIVL